MDKQLVDSLRELMVAIVNQCAQAVNDIPASASLYENATVAKAVIEFKAKAINEILNLAEPNP